MSQSDPFDSSSITSGTGSVPLSSRRSLLQAALGLTLFGFGARAARAAYDPNGGLEQFLKINVKPDVYLAEVFANQVPAPQVLETGGKALGLMLPTPQRLRYWRANGRTCWIFDDIGKAGYAPTTCGFIVKGPAIESARVLIYRESRGEQIGQPSFLQQLSGAKGAGGALDKHVDNISGATYSVKMMERMAAAALVLNASAPA